ncbi:hypothetical protein [Levilinea saccharolytica]|uniref:HEAT repeat domain-containing protein n=1 Tax=Levilinea saccharolytica TaxID=229921 RepID=A0A0P6X0I9_9CHLR|nr:hypothetical protein [Levilinea saccharolytica]KPL75729.1 hypothetical protein ADN01_18070 [Levilinea saccharolytica]GAP16680.1 hypothetical protein LSAC_00536 [Levilinea saccharolytica]
MYTIDYLLTHSNLPGPRGNLELLYAFAKSADEGLVEQCLAYITEDVSNSPEEFVGMCGVLGYAVLHREDIRGVIRFLRPYAAHASWRIREAAAMGIQEISVGRVAQTLAGLAEMAAGNEYEQRAVVAGLCEPKLLTDPACNRQILRLLTEITQGLAPEGKLSPAGEALRKALGYGWSVVMAASPADGKAAFEGLLDLPGKHVRWVIRENLKKNRLMRMDADWVGEMQQRLAPL